MTPSSVTSSAMLDLFSTPKETFLALWTISNGGHFPENVYDINPFQCKPENLPDAVWYYVKCNGNADSSFGRWKPIGGDCILYSDSSFTGRSTTYEYYEGQAPHECKTAWVLQKYWISHSGLGEISKHKETSSLCKVFLGDELFQNHKKIQKSEPSIILKSEPNNLNRQLVVPDDSTANNMANGSTSKSEMCEDDKMVELAVAGKPLDRHLEEILPEGDVFSDDDYIELRDLAMPTSRSSSSENSSCLTMSSDENCDIMDVLWDAERDINHDRAQRDAACIRSSAPSRLKKEVVYQGASEAFVSIKRSYSPAKDNLKINSTASGSGCREPDLKLPSQSEKEGYKSKGASSSHNKMVSNGQETAGDGGKKIKKKKKMRKKYLCFLSF